MFRLSYRQSQALDIARHSRVRSLKISRWQSLLYQPHEGWRYWGETQPLPNTQKQLSTLCDLRVPLTFDLDDCRTLGSIVREVANESL